MFYSYANITGNRIREQITVQRLKNGHPNFGLANDIIQEMREKTKVL